MSSLVCSMCGAPLPREAADAAVACTFCGTTSTRAPRVVEREVERIVERVVVRDASGAPATLECLRCGQSMRDVSVDGMTVTQCPSCGGAWVPAEVAARLRHRSNDELRRFVAQGEMLALARPPRARPTNERLVTEIRDRLLTTIREVLDRPQSRPIG